MEEMTGVEGEDLSSWQGEMNKNGGNRDEKRGHQGTYFGRINDSVC